MAGVSDEILLSGGHLADDGIVHYSAELAPLDGTAEEALADAPARTCAARLLTLLLAGSVRRIGRRI